MAKTRRKKRKRIDLSLGGSKKKHPISATRGKTLRSDSMYLKLVKERVEKGKGIIDIPNMLIAMNRVNPRLTAVKIGEIEAGLKRVNFLISKLEDEHSKALELSLDSTPRGTREPIAKKGSLFKEARSRFKSMQRSELATNNGKKSK
jgi:hypothetical protein